MLCLVLAVGLLLARRRRLPSENCSRRQHCLTREEKKAQKYERRRGALKKRKRRRLESESAVDSPLDVGHASRGESSSNPNPTLAIREAQTEPAALVAPTSRKLTRAQRRAASGLDDIGLESRRGAIRVVVDLALGAAANDARECRSLAKQLGQA